MVGILVKTAGLTTRQNRPSTKRGASWAVASLKAKQVSEMEHLGETTKSCARRVCGGYPTQ
jgi:hypothetical protein